jgi:hypothetical protein
VDGSLAGACPQGALSAPPCGAVLFPTLGGSLPRHSGPKPCRNARKQFCAFRYAPVRLQQRNESTGRAGKGELGAGAVPRAVLDYTSKLHAHRDRSHSAESVRPAFYARDLPFADRFTHLGYAGCVARGGRSAILE